MADKIAEDARFCSEAEERRGEEGGRAQRRLSELAIEKEKSGSARRRFHQIVCDAEVAAEFAELKSAAETLRAKFEKIAVTALGANHATGARGGFDDVGVDAGLAQIVGASQAGNSGADDEDWDVSGHGIQEPSYHLEVVLLKAQSGRRKAPEERHPRLAHCQLRIWMKTGSNDLGNLES